MESWIESLAKNIQKLSEVILMDSLGHESIESLYEIIDEMRWIIQEVEEFKNE